MAQITINNGDSGAVVRADLNDMFGELYGAIVPPIRLPGTTANVEQQILSNTYVSKIFMRLTPGQSAATVAVGTTGGAGDIMPATQITTFAEINYSEYFLDQADIYFTITGGGSVDIVIMQLTPLF